MLKDVFEVELNKEDMFQHFIYLRREDGSLEGKIAVSPSESDDMFKDVNKKWVEATKKDANGI